MNLNSLLTTLGLTAMLAGCGGAATGDGVSLRQHEGAWQVCINGRPIYINGVGGTNRLDVAEANGANAFRTWGGSVESISEDLELARTHHMYVMQGIGLPKDSMKYHDEAWRKQTLEEVQRLAQTFKNDTSIFAWGIGNEIELDNRANTPTAWQFVNLLAQEIKKIDRRHLVSTVISHNPGALDMVAKYAPDLDFVGINSYGGIMDVKDIVARSAYRGPYLITEWGPTGWWETTKTAWGAPIEQTSEEKRQVYEERYTRAITADPRCMGSFVFLWGQKEERTPTWFCLFVEDDVEGLPLRGEKTPMVEAMQRVWTRQEPTQTAPVVQSIAIDGTTFEPRVRAGRTFEGTIAVTDREGDSLTYVWEVLKEATVTATGGAYEPRPDRVGQVQQTSEPRVTLAIAAPGYYRLYGYVLDGTGYVSTANIPFAVE